MKCLAGVVTAHNSSCRKIMFLQVSDCAQGVFIAHNSSCRKIMFLQVSDCAQGVFIPACTWGVLKTIHRQTPPRQTPPPSLRQTPHPQMDTEAGVMHPTGMHFCCFRENSNYDRSLSSTNFKKRNKISRVGDACQGYLQIFQSKNAFQ